MGAADEEALSLEADVALGVHPPHLEVARVADLGRVGRVGDKSLLRLRDGSFYTYDSHRHQLQLVRLPEAFHPVSSLLELSGDIFIAAKEGLFELKNEQLVHAFNATIIRVFRLADSLLLVTPEGLIRYKDHNPRELGISLEAQLLDAAQVGSYLLLLTPASLYSFGSELVTLLEFTAPVESPQLRQADQHALLYLIQAGRGRLYHFEAGKLTELERAVDPSDFVVKDGALIIAAGYSGVYELRDSTLSIVVPRRVIEGLPPLDRFSLVKNEGWLFGWSRTIGLQRYSNHVFSDVFSWQPTGQVLRVVAVGKEVLVLARRGLFRFVDAQNDFPVATPTRDTESLASNEGQTIAVKVQHPCAASFKKTDFGFVPFDDVTQEVWPEIPPSDVALDIEDEQTVTWYGSIELPKGTYSVSLAVFEGAQRVPVSSPISFRVAWGPAEHIANGSRLAAPWIFAAHSLLFLGLLAGARRSRWCWSVVSDPFWGRAGLWFYFALRHIGVAQRWVMDRWFAEVRANLQPVAYVPIPLRDGEDRALLPSDLLARLKSSPRLWIQGNAGMGKTVLVADLEQNVFGESANLFAARNRFGFVPIVVPLRRFANLAPDSERPELFIAELARRAVAEHGPEFENASLFRAILTNGGFVVLLDGANEVPYSDNLEYSARALHPIRVLITSQADQDHPPEFEVLHLPPNVKDAIQPLLNKFLGEELSGAVSSQLEHSPLAADIRSGYDVRLLADLVAARKTLPELPADRIGLYDAILAAVVLPDHSPYPVDLLCEAAWRMWRDGERRLVPHSHLPEHLCDALLREHAKVLRTLDGKDYEFRHDQMRGFLAARWAAVHTVDPIHLFETDKTIWQRATSDQEIVWSFFATMIQRPKGVRVWQWSTREPHRAVLQHALQQVGEVEEWDLSVKPTAQNYRS